MSTKSTEHALSEQLARRDVANIEQIARHGLSPTEELSPPETNEKPRKLSAVEMSNHFEDRDEALESMIAEMERSMGTTLVVSSRDELNRALERLRPAFEAIAAAIRAHVAKGDSEGSSELFEQLRILIQSVFTIGAQATVSTRAERFVKPKIKRAGTSGARATRADKVRAERESIKEIERLNRLDDAIRATLDEPLTGKLARSSEFAGRIYDKVRKRLGVESKETRPTQGEIRKRVRAIDDARHSRIQQTE